MARELAYRGRTGRRPRGLGAASPATMFIPSTGFPAWGPGGIYYVRLGPESIVVRDVRAGREVEDVPVATVDADGHVLAVGREAKGHDGRDDGRATLRQPFVGPTVAAADREVAVEILRHQLSRLRRVSWLPMMIRGMVVHHLAADSEVLEIDAREALLAVARQAGARAPIAWAGRQLSDQEVIEAIAPPAYRL